MTESDIFEEFETRWHCVPQCWEAARNLVSPNKEDDDFVKMAIVGFSYHDKTENWRQGHCEIARRYLNESEEIGDPEDIRKFNMLALGALLGLYSANKIDDRLYNVGFALLPGFVLGKGKSPMN